MSKSTLEMICQYVEQGCVQEARAATEKALSERIDPVDILNKGLIEGLDIIGERFGRQEAFVPELITAAMAMKESLDLLRPFFEGSEIPNKGTLVIGTVEGDVHDVGKNIVAMMFQGCGIKVIDLGVDVPAANFVEAVKENNADILALSALYTPTRLAMKETLEAVSDAGIRDKVKIMIGGAPIDQAFCDLIKADGYAPDAAKAVQLGKAWLQKPLAWAGEQKG
jgi:5-methyltetrahydrofolate--homocysteine methyltransferase